MPYRTNSELPKAVKEKLTDHQQSVFRNVFNSMMGEKGMTEARAYAGAWAQAKKAPEVKKEILADIIKVNQEERLAYGWAYVTKADGEVSYDHSKEWMTSDTLTKAATDFMLNSRTAKSMHSGEKVADIVHSLPVTKEVADALGIQTDREGWIIGVRVNDEETWQMVKSGKLSSFSIGGRAVGGNPRLRG